MSANGSSHSQYEAFMYELIEDVEKGASSAIERLEGLSPSIALRICRIIIEFACQAQNELPILAGRRAFERLPREWVDLHLDEAVRQVLDLSDDWDYTRLLELVSPSYPAWLKYYCDWGFSSGNEDIIETAHHMCRNGDHAKRG